MTPIGRNGWESVSYLSILHIKLFNTQPTVQALSQKYKTAELALGIVVLTFEGLTRSVGRIAEWEKLEAKVMKVHGEAMMICNVSPVQGMVQCYYLGGAQPLLISDKTHLVLTKQHTSMIQHRVHAHRLFQTSPS